MATGTKQVMRDTRWGRIFIRMVKALFAVCLISLTLSSSRFVSGNAPPIKFAEHAIATDLRGGYQVVVADLNHDGKPDIIALASGMKELVWFENPGWQRHVLV